jgi:hypothetical protein
MRASYNEWKYFHSRSIFCAENELFCKKKLHETGVHCEGPDEWPNSKRESPSQ